jgi:hypothetical protein
MIMIMLAQTPGSIEKLGDHEATLIAIMPCCNFLTGTRLKTKTAVWFIHGCC